MSNSTNEIAKRLEDATPLTAWAVTYEIRDAAGDYPLRSIVFRDKERLLQEAKRLTDYECIKSISEPIELCEKRLLDEALDQLKECVPWLECVIDFASNDFVTVDQTELKELKALLVRIKTPKQGD